MDRFGLALLTVWCLYACSSSDEVRRDRLFLQANNALSEREYDLAIDLYTQALAIDDTFARAYNNRGVAKIEDDRPAEALLDYNAALMLDPQYTDALFNRAYAYEQLGRIRDALADVERVQGIYPDSSYVYFYRGLLEAKLKDYDRGIQNFQKALQLDAANVESRVNLATLYYYKDHLDTAREMLLDILKGHPHDVNALNTLSQIYLKEQDFQNALLMINRALELVPGEPYFLNNRGQIYLEMDSLATALKDINRSILRDPKNAWAYRNKGVYYLRKGQPEEARRLLEEAISRNAFIEEVYAPLGEAHRQLGRLPEACAAWQKGATNKEARSRELWKKYCYQ